MLDAEQQQALIKQKQIEIEMQKHVLQRNYQQWMQRLLVHEQRKKAASFSTAAQAHAKSMQFQSTDINMSPGMFGNLSTAVNVGSVNTGSSENTTPVAAGSRNVQTSQNTPYSNHMVSSLSIGNNTTSSGTLPVSNGTDGNFVQMDLALSMKHSDSLVADPPLQLDSVGGLAGTSMSAPFTRQMSLLSDSSRHASADLPPTFPSDEFNLPEVREFLDYKYIYLDNWDPEKTIFFAFGGVTNFMLHESHTKQNMPSWTNNSSKPITATHY